MADESPDELDELLERRKLVATSLGVAADVLFEVERLLGKGGLPERAKVVQAAVASVPDLSEGGFDDVEAALKRLRDPTPDEDGHSILDFFRSRWPFRDRSLAIDGDALVDEIVAPAERRRDVWVASRGRGPVETTQPRRRSLVPYTVLFTALILLVAVVGGLTLYFTNATFGAFADYAALFTAAAGLATLKLIVDVVALSRHRGPTV